jgi:hypothetical protein
VLAPNRCSFSVSLRDPHYRLPLIVWFPQRWRDFLVRTLGRGDHFDGTWFPSMRELIQAFNNVDIELAAVARMDKSGPRETSVRFLSRFLWGYPIYIGVKSGTKSGS